MVKLAENAGFGFDKIEENWRAYNSTVPEYQIEFDSVVVDFKMSDEESVGENCGRNCGENHFFNQRKSQDYSKTN
jgi:predicted HTH transcriptional regulator